MDKLRSKYLTLSWLLLATAIISAIAYLEWRGLNATLVREIDNLQRAASQRADQHDAHLTNLSAVAVAGSSPREDLFLEVASTILKFYPRITAIDLLPLKPTDPQISTRATVLTDMKAAVLSAARETDGRLILLSTSESEGRYQLVKRSPNSEAARFGLALEIDGVSLLNTQSRFWSKGSVQLALQVPGGPFLIGQKVSGSLVAQRVLSSKSQPLILNASFTPAYSELLPPARVFLGLVAMTVFLTVLTALGKSLKRARQAEQSARLSAQETRLAHAARVNGLGEMASGLAHELTQPLTAILSQSQAGLRLLDRKIDAQSIQSVLSDTVEQARRASAILERLRNWSRPTRGQAAVTSVNHAVKGVKDLVAAELRNKSITLNLDLDVTDTTVLADPVELEQVIFNMLSNALQAIEDGENDTREINVVTNRNSDTVSIEITDTGSGVSEELRATLFDPFVTGRVGGTGLGLALSARLVERMNGEITMLPSTGIGAQFQITLPHSSKVSLSEAAE